MSETAATFGFVDLARFTALTEAHGDAEAVTLLERFEALVREGLGPDDRLVKTIGDAVMIAFADPAAAVGAMARMFDGCMAETGFPVPRAGLHHGTAVERGGDFFGAAVNLAARVAGQAHGGQVLSTGEVAAAARRAGVGVVDLGAFSLRNIAGPVELFQLDVCPTTAGAAVDPVCRMRVPRTEAAGRLRYEDADYWFCSLDCIRTFATDPTPYAALTGEHLPSTDHPAD